MTILVTGATGNVGGHVLRQLRERGVPVRALTRNPAAAKLPDDVEVVAGDLAAPETLDAAFEGVSAAYLITFDGSDGSALTTGPEIAKRALAAGVRHVTMLWSGQPGPLEADIAASGLSWTTLQPVEFMSNTLLWADSIRTEGVARDPFAGLRSAMVHEADIAAVAVETLLNPGHNGREYVLSGLEVLTVPDKIAQLSAATGRDIRFVELTEEQARARLRDMGASPEAVDHVIGWYADPPVEGYTVVDTVERVTGRPARTFAQWARENADAFR
ncbi:NAD(P)H-binding protein [Amycolatopsis albispora]|uniref:Hydroxylase n=1 Tax=Amycolatopsis albispora TaxID=1804986 RepID=A0A344LAY6_9PSEU|nr:NAD(P)H-binding protein [Amycolatopsis albispora]AXB45210.1 hydroxylase [Amycolatopsis albispora]